MTFCNEAVTVLPNRGHSLSKAEERKTGVVFPFVWTKGGTSCTAHFFQQKDRKTRHTRNVSGTGRVGAPAGHGPAPSRCQRFLLRAPCQARGFCFSHGAPALPNPAFPRERQRETRRARLRPSGPRPRRHPPPPSAPRSAGPARRRLCSRQPAPDHRRTALCGGARRPARPTAPAAAPAGPRSPGKGETAGPAAAAGRPHPRPGGGWPPRRGEERERLAPPHGKRAGPGQASIAARAWTPLPQAQRPGRAGDSGARLPPPRSAPTCYWGPRERSTAESGASEPGARRRQRQQRRQRRQRRRNHPRPALGPPSPERPLLVGGRRVQGPTRLAGARALGALPLACRTCFGNRRF